jgi:hypothetical protein
VAFLRFVSVMPESGFTVRTVLSDGTIPQLDLEDLLVGPVFEAMRTDPQRFSEVFVDPVSRTLAWPGGVDLDPEVLLGTPIASAG